MEGVFTEVGVFNRAEKEEGETFGSVLSIIVVLLIAGGVVNEGDVKTVQEDVGLTTVEPGAIGTELQPDLYASAK